MMLRVMLLAVYVVVVAYGDSQKDPTYDHQNVPYKANHHPVEVSAPSDLSVMAYFSPEYSSSTLVDFINSANSTIEVGTPGFSSWSGCTPYDPKNGSTCLTACTPANQSAEAFPIFPALLNAVHRGVAVRLLTNDYGTSDCAGTISPLPFLALNGVAVRYFSTGEMMDAPFRAFKPQPLLCANLSRFIFISLYLTCCVCV